jgi:hypothetical protein
MKLEAILDIFTYLFMVFIVPLFLLISTYEFPLLSLIIDSDDFRSRLNQIINTHWLASLAPEASTDNIPGDSRDLLARNSTVLRIFFFEANGPNATTFYLEEVYSCNRG